MAKHFIFKFPKRKKWASTKSPFVKPPKVILLPSGDVLFKPKRKTWNLPPHVWRPGDDPKSHRPLKAHVWGRKVRPS